MNTLICLVSAQRMQNTLPLFQKGFAFDRVITLVSADQGKPNPKFLRIAREMAAVLGTLASWVEWPVPLDPMDPQATYNACAQIIQKAGQAQQVTINFTGGTKPMSIGAYQAGIEMGASLLYVDTEMERFYHYQRSASPETIPFQLQPILAAQILALHSRKIYHSKTQGQAFTEKMLQVGQCMLDRRHQTVQEFGYLQQLFHKHKGQTEEKGVKKAIPPMLVNSGDMNETKWALEQLDTLGWIEHNAEGILIHPAALLFLDGNWFELYTYSALKTKPQFMDVLARQCIAGIENELDCVVVFQGKLGIVECKSGSLNKGKGTTALNNLHTLNRELAGIFGKSFFVSTGSPSAAFTARAKEYGIDLICGEDALRVEEIVFDRMSAKNR